MVSVREFLAQRPPGPLYHYTDANGLLGILQEKELWASNALHLNDAGEVSHGLTLLSQEIEKLLALAVTFPSDMKDAIKYWQNDLRKEAAEGPLVVSFSEVPDQLSQWRAYCRDGSGYSIGFGLGDLQFAMSSSKFLLVKCVYTPSEQFDLTMAVVRFLRRGFQHKKASRIGFMDFYRLLVVKAFAVLLALKHEGFREEQEWRLVSLDSDLPLKFRPGRFGIVPYCAIPLCKPGEKLGLANVYVGPNAAPDIATAAVRELLWLHTRHHPHPQPEVIASQIPYRV
jgi:hypothetical protein